MSEAKEPRRPMNVHCGLCGHEWTACWLPMEASKACKVLLSTHCPMCGAEPSKIRMGGRPRPCVPANEGTTAEGAVG
jgi:hypothetical protein